MIKTLTLIFLFTLSLQADFIKDMKGNPKIIVVHGENAPEREKKVAKDLFEALNLGEVDDLYDHIITDTYCLKHQFFYSSFHLLIVGTRKSNKLCSLNAEVQYALAAQNKSPINIFPAANKTGDGLFSARYGYYPEPEGIGYVRRMLNPFTLQSFNMAGKKFQAQPWSATFITGNDTDGVANAYAQMFDNKMIEGITVPEEKLLPSTSRFRLGKKSMTASLPKEITPVDFKEEKEEMNYKGWIQGTVGDYAGVKNLTGVKADQIFHLKYQGKDLSLMSYDDHKNTLLCIKFKDTADCIKALKGLDKAMRLALAISEKADFKVHPCSNGRHEFSIARKGSYLIIENFDSKWKAPFIREAGKMIK